MTDDRWLAVWRDSDVYTDDDGVERVRPVAYQKVPPVVDGRFVTTEEETRDDLPPAGR